VMMAFTTSVFTRILPSCTVMVARCRSRGNKNRGGGGGISDVLVVFSWSAIMHGAGGICCTVAEHTRPDGTWNHARLPQLPGV
jgi:hypothetical protein